MFRACSVHIAVCTELFSFCRVSSRLPVFLSSSIKKALAVYVYYYNRLTVNVNSKIEIKRKFAKIFLGRLAACFRLVLISVLCVVASAAVVGPSGLAGWPAIPARDRRHRRGNPGHPPRRRFTPPNIFKRKKAQFT